MITVILTAIVLAFLLNPIVKNLESKGIKRWIGIIIVYIFLTLVLFCIAYLAFPPLIRTIEQFAVNLPNFEQALKDNIDKFLDIKLLSGIPENMKVMLQDKISGLTGIITNTGGDISGWLLNISAISIDLTLGIILAYYLILDLDKVKGGFIEFLPKKFRVPFKELAFEIYIIFIEFIKGQGLSALVVGLVSFVILIILKVKYAFVLAITVGITEMIPYIGPIIGAIPSVIVAYGDSPGKAIWVVIGYFILQQISGGILAPKLVGERVGLHPITSIIVIALGGKWFGVLGMIFAVPVFASIKATILKFIKIYT